MLIPISSGIARANVSFITGLISDSVIDPAVASATVTFANDGSYDGTASGGGGGFSGDWIAPPSAAGNAYEIRMTVNSGTTPSGAATGSWLGLGTTRTWVLSQSGVGSVTANVTVEIRLAATGVVLSSGSGAFDMTAQVTV